MVIFNPSLVALQSNVRRLAVPVYFIDILLLSNSYPVFKTFFTSVGGLTTWYGVGVLWIRGFSSAILHSRIPIFLPLSSQLFFADLYSLSRFMDTNFLDLFTCSCEV